MIRAFLRGALDAVLDRAFTWALWRGVRDRDARVVVTIRSVSLSRELEERGTPCAVCGAIACLHFLGMTNVGCDVCDAKGELTKRAQDRYRERMRFS